MVTETHKQPENCDKYNECSHVWLNFISIRQVLVMSFWDWCSFLETRGNDWLITAQPILGLRHCEVSTAKMNNTQNPQLTSNKHYQWQINVELQSTFKLSAANRIIWIEIWHVLWHTHYITRKTEASTTDLHQSITTTTEKHTTTKKNNWSW